MTRDYSFACRDDAAKQEFWSCLALRETPGLGMRRIGHLLTYFGSAYKAVQNRSSWGDAGIPKSCITNFSKESWRQAAYREWTAAKTFPCSLLLWTDSEYSPGLRSIIDPPPFLYFCGDLSLLRNFAVAVVGTRACSEEGLKTTINITRGLAKAGATIVSGMAKGIDRVAHLAGLEGPGSSIGVLGAGIDSEYPRHNRDLYALMREKGLLLSELPPGFGVDAKWFPIRNRIISGLSKAVVVVEAALRSGSLNTARHAIEQNRELMAVPGPASSSTARGCQQLVRSGVKSVFHADDILHELAPFLSEHVRHELQERERAQSTFVQNQADTREDSSDASQSLLPWRGVKKEVREAEKRRTVKNVPESMDILAGTDKKIVEPKRLKPSIPLDGLEAAIFSLVLDNPLQIDDISRSLGQNTDTVSRAVTMLEVRGLLKRLPGMVYTVPEDILNGR